MKALQPREMPLGGGRSAFSTQDELLYFRDRGGTLRRGMSKEQERANRKAAKKLRKVQQ